MKLLICTQKVDINDDVLGFFHGWIAEFARHCERVTVVALGAGEYDLPENVKVLSLGKKATSYQLPTTSPKWLYGYMVKLLYACRFYRYIWQERKNYDAVFVHMNPVYVVLGGLLWKLWGKRIGLWHNHEAGNFFTRLGVILCDKVWHTSAYAFTARYKKSKIMPAGINTKIFNYNSDADMIKNSILSVGRISPIKNVDILIKAAEILDKKGVAFSVNIYGDPPVRDEEYYHQLKESASALVKKRKLKFHRQIPNYKIPKIYRKHEIFVNMTNSGSFDKTTLEAMACGNLVIASNRTLADILGPELLFREKDANDLADKLFYALNIEALKKRQIIKRLEDFSINKHSLKRLAREVIKDIQSYANN